jgi:phosphoenolpyruvate carboxykinase (ATP)
LSQEKEPQIWGAIRDGAILENIEYIPGTRTVDYSSIKKTENTRAAYRIDAVSNALKLSVGGVPKNIFFFNSFFLFNFFF